MLLYVCLGPGAELPGGGGGGRGPRAADEAQPGDGATAVLVRSLAPQQGITGSGRTAPSSSSVRPHSWGQPIAALWIEGNHGWVECGL